MTTLDLVGVLTMAVLCAFTVGLSVYLYLRNT